MKKRRTLRALSVLMALVMSFSAVQSLPVAAAQAAENQSNTQVQQDKEPEFLPGDLTEKELQTAKLTESDTPEVVDEELIEEKGHVNRLREQENDLNTIVFQNKNGSKTMYIYAAPVKYKDETGKVKDKKNKLSEQDIEPELAEDYGLTNPENDVRTYFPKKLNKNKGVVLQYGDVKLEVSPLKHHKTQKAQAATLSLESQPQAVVMANEAPGQKKKQNKTDVVEYDKVFGKNTVLRYSATLNGFKEDLILQENIGVNEFSFRVKTNGLSLLKEGEVCYFADPLTGEMVSRVGDILVYDSKDPEVQAQSEVAAESVSYDHHYTVETVEEDQEYILTMVIDEAYLNSPDTVYPVTVDPSFTIDGSRNSDTTIYTNYSKTDWKNGSMFAGNYNKRFPKYDRGTARALVRVPYWYDGLINLQTSQINSVKLDLSDLYPGNPPNTISVYKMNEYWDDLSAVCSDKLWDGYDKNAISTREFKWGNRDYEDDNGVHHYLVDITKAVKDWKDGKTTDNGLMLKAEDESIAARVFGTVDGNYPLNLEVSYGKQLYKPLTSDFLNDIVFPPTHFPDGKEINSENKYDKYPNSQGIMQIYTSIYFENYIWPAQVKVYEHDGVPSYLRTPMPTAFYAWAKNAYGKNWLETIWGVLDIFIGVLYDVVCSTVDGAIHVVTQPEDVIEGTKYILNAVLQDGPEREVLSTLITSSVEQCYNDFVEGDADTKIRMVSRVVAEVLVSYISAKGAEKAISLFKNSKWLAKISGAIGKGEVTSKTALKVLDGAIDATKKMDDSMYGLSYANKTVKTAKEINEWWGNFDYRPPYNPLTEVWEFDLTRTGHFVRVYEEQGKSAGGWLMKAEDVTGLTAEQIKNKYALSFKPNYICDVEIPNGSTLRCGITNPLENWGDGGGVQFDLMRKQIGRFYNERPLS